MNFHNDSSSESKNKSLSVSVQLFSKISSKSSILSHILHVQASLAIVRGHGLAPVSSGWGSNP